MHAPFSLLLLPFVSCTVHFINSTLPVTFRAFDLFQRPRLPTEPANLLVHVGHLDLDYPCRITQVHSPAASGTPLLLVDWSTGGRHGCYSMVDA
jgi:hypothetical protein